MVNRSQLIKWPGPLCVGALLMFGLVSCVHLPPEVHANPMGVRILQTNDVLQVELNGRLFTRYHYANVPRPFCYPLLGPDSTPMTRRFPMEKVAGETTDHPHHRSLWFAHAPVNGVDVWTERKDSGRIVHRGFADIASGVNAGQIKSLNDWVDAEGRVLCSDETTLKFYAPTNGAITLDYEISLKATHGDVIFGDSKEGTFAVRVAESMRVLKPAQRGEPAQPGAGHIVLSSGVSDDGASAAAAKNANREAVTWGKRADWCDYYGPVDGKMVGIAIMDHPNNPRHPTWWHVRDYGLFAANPFGKHDFESLSDKHAGDLKIPNGQSITFRYRLVLHEGDAKSARIAERYADYARNAESK